MGATFTIETVSDCSPSELRTRFQELRDQDAYENGHDGYSGGLGTKHDVKILNHKFATDEEAEDYLERVCDKHGKAIAVRLKLPTPATQAKVTRLEKKIQELCMQKMLPAKNSQSKQAIEQGIVERVRNGKSAKKTCTTCQSNIATSYIRRIACPICGDDQYLLTKADKAKMDTQANAKARLDQKIQTLQEQIKDAKLQDKSEKAVWLIGALCPA